MLSTCSLLKNVQVDGSRSLSDAMSQTRKTAIRSVIEGFRTLSIYLGVNRYWVSLSVEGKGNSGLIYNRVANIRLHVV